MGTLSASNASGLKFAVTFNATGSVVVTDPPAGHGGEGTSFAPTDLLDAALMSCTGTMIAVKAGLLGFDAKGMTVTASHTMADAPRRIGAIDMVLELPFTPDVRQKKSLLAAAAACPVRSSLRSDLAVKMTVKWADGGVDVVER